jgi:hypothetical protein
MSRFCRTLNALALSMLLLAILPQHTYARQLASEPTSQGAAADSSPFAPAAPAGQPPAAAAPLAAASIPISGIISDGQTGWTLYARVELSGPTTVQTYTDSVSGFYRLDVAAAGTYTLKAYAVSSGYLVGSRSISVTSAGGVFDLQLQVDARACVATGYQRTIVGAFEQFSATTIPAGWSVVDNYGNQGVWRFDNPQNRTNLTGGSGGFAMADNGIYGGLTTLDTELRSPAYNFSALSTVTIQFDTDLKREWAPYGGTRGYADVSIDNGATWTTVLHLDNAYRGWVNVDVSDLAAGKSQVRLRLHFISHAGSYWWQVDNLSFGRFTCDPSAGRLVVGHVYDANTNAGVNGATVAVSATHKATTVATPLDLRTDDGFYSLFVPQASQTITASAAWGYANDVRTPPAGAATVRQDFVLQAGRLALQPATLAQTLTMGLETTSAFSITNVGTLPVDLSLDRGPWGVTPATAAWARTAPLSLTLAPGASRLVTVTLDAGDPSIVQPVAHATRLVVANNDPYPTLALPIALAVTPPPDWGLISGAVNLLNTCDLPGWPAGYAPLTIVSGAGVTWKTTTNQAGRYNWWADPQAGPYSVSASWTNYIPQTASGLIVTAQATTTHTMNLRPNRPCWRVTPPVTSLAATVTLGTVGTVALPLQNTGAQTTTLELVNAAGTVVAWMPGLPVTVILAGDSQQNVALAVDARTSVIKQPGTYEMVLRVRSKTYDPVNAQVNLPLKLTVVPPADWSLLEGTVTRIDSCGLNAAPASGATLTVTDRSNASFTATASVSGTYKVWFNPATAPLTVTFQLPQYLSQTLTGVDGGSGGSQTRDVTLGLDAPCAGIQPGQISLTQPAETRQVVPVTISNTGSKPLEFTLAEVGVAGARDRTDVLVYGTISYQADMLKGLLQSYPDIGSVTVWTWENNLALVPPLDTLKNYDLVVSIRSPNYSYPDPAGLGDVLADYIDEGGKVIVLASSWDWNIDAIAGRFTTGGYNPFIQNAWAYGAPLTLGTYDAGHPLMRGVSSASTYVFSAVKAAPGATLVASWSIGHAMVATTPGVVAINGAPDGYRTWGGDMPRILHNSLVYLLDSPWLTGAPAFGTVAPGATKVISLTLDSTVMPAVQPGVFSTTLMLEANLGPSPAVPLTLTVTPGRRPGARSRALSPAWPSATSPAPRCGWPRSPCAGAAAGPGAPPPAATARMTSGSIKRLARSR